MTLSFLIEMQLGEDTRLTADERTFIELLRSNAEAVAWAFTKGARPAIRALKVPADALLVIKSCDE